MVVRPLGIVAGVLLLGIVVFGVVLRANEILQTEAIGAEDPYTHVVFTREYLEKGAFVDSVYLGTPMYPPGMHAVVGVLATLGGVDIVTMAKWVPLGFAALAIVGTFAIAQRLGGAPAGLASAFLVATIPEHVFRTQLLFPTALDLALLPAWLLMFHEACRPGIAAQGRSSRAPAALLFLALSVPLAWMHPWVIPLFGVPCLLYVALRTLRAKPGPAAAMRGLVLPVVLIALTTAFAMASRWDQSDTGFADFAADFGPLSWLASIHMSPTMLFLLLATVLMAAGLVGVLTVAGLATVKVPRRLGRVVAVVVGLSIALFVWSWPMGHGLPAGVNYGDMFGRLAIFLSLAGIVVALARPTPLGDLALALGLVLAPLTAIDVLHSPFWPQRTVAYLSFAVALLGGATVGAVATMLTRPVRSPRLRRAVVPMAAVASLLVVAGAGAAMPAKSYEWYRLYDDKEYAAFTEIDAFLQEHPGARIFVGSWQPGLMIKALGEPDRVWQDPAFFKDAAKRKSALSVIHGEPFVLVEKYTRKEADKGRADLSFLKGSPVVWQTADHGIQIYRLK